jgi:CubicO group peptidase (beta-lactamase class C family)
VAESDLFLRTSELARFGRLLLDDGRHEGRQLVPAGYCARIAAESVPTASAPEDQGLRLAPRYGLGAWCGPGDGTFSMAGRHGQLCIVSPPREAVVTITAHVEAGSARTSITTLVTEELLDRL